MRWIALSLFVFLFQLANCQSVKPELNVNLITSDLKTKANSIVRYSKKEFVCEDSRKATWKVHTIVTVLNKKGESFNKLSVSYDKLSSVESIKGNLYSSTGKLIKKIEKKRIEDHSYISSGSLYEDSRYKSAGFYYDDYPYTVEFEYEVSYKDYLDIFDWAPVPKYFTSIEKSIYIVTIPSNDSLRFVSPGISDDPIVNTDQNNKSYKWIIENLPAMRKEPYSPDLQTIAPHVMVSSRHINYNNLSGENTSWYAFGEFMFDLNKNLDALPEEASQAVLDIIETAQTKREKVKAIYHELQNTTRYVNVSLDIGGYKAYDATYVYENKYGDCKALSNYMQAMLRVAGIASYWALVYAGDDEPDVNIDFPSNQFNHVILAVPDTEDTIWLECTSQEIPFDYLGDFTSNRHVLLITPEGGKLVTTPPLYADDNLLITRATNKINEAGQTISEVSFTSTGSQSKYFEYIFLRLSDEEQKEFLYSLIDLPSFYINRFEFQKPYPDSTKFKLLMNNELYHYCTKSGSRIFFNPNMYNRFSNVPKKVKQRKYPFHVQKPYYDIDTLIYKLPDNVYMESAPDSLVEFSTDYGYYRALTSFDKKTNTLEYIREFKMKKFTKPASEYDAFRTFLKSVSAADQRQIVLKMKDN